MFHNDTVEAFMRGVFYIMLVFGITGVLMGTVPVITLLTGCWTAVRIMD